MTREKISVQELERRARAEEVAVVLIDNLRLTSGARFEDVDTAKKVIASMLQSQLIGVQKVQKQCRDAKAKGFTRVGVVSYNHEDFQKFIIDKPMRGIIYEQIAGTAILKIKDFDYILITERAKESSAYQSIRDEVERRRMTIRKANYSPYKQ